MNVQVSDSQQYLSQTAVPLLLGAREKRQGQNRLPRLILYEHHQGWIVPAALFPQF
jgi:hypothetical protein